MRNRQFASPKPNWPNCAKPHFLRLSATTWMCLVICNVLLLTCQATSCKKLKWFVAQNASKSYFTFILMLFFYKIFLEIHAFHVTQCHKSIWALGARTSFKDAQSVESTPVSVNQLSQVHAQAAFVPTMEWVFFFSKIFQTFLSNLNFFSHNALLFESLTVPN